nr:hypothetical protein HmN_000825700 [Hymenolepis microstoma]CDS28528.1 hypothetical protein HmN_000825800 [Hymenolepis microstoma]
MKGFEEGRVHLDDDSRGEWRETHHSKKSRKHLSCAEPSAAGTRWRRWIIGEIANEAGIAHGLAFPFLTVNQSLSKLSVPKSVLETTADPKN